MKWPSSPHRPHHLSPPLPPPRPLLNVGRTQRVGGMLAVLLAGPCAMMGLYSVQWLRHRAMHNQAHQGIQVPSLKFEITHANLTWLDECGVTSLCIAVYVLQLIGVLAYPCTLGGRALLGVQVVLVPLIHLVTATKVISYTEYQTKVNRCVVSLENLKVKMFLIKILVIKYKV